MKIAQIAPLWERVPPPAYGGIELVVGLLTDELVARGHEVTLFASGDSLTSAKLESIHPQALRLDPNIKECGIYDMLQMAQVYERAGEFDLIHSHMGCVALPYSKLTQTPTVHTLHGIFTPDNEKMFLHAKTQPYVSISNAQREERLGLNHIATVYNSIDVSMHHFFPVADEPPYLAFLGRMSTQNGWKSRSGGRGILRGAHQAAGRWRADSVLGRSGSLYEERSDGSSHCDSVPNYLARTVWTGNDRVDGSRYPCNCHESGIGSRSRR
jgi:glycosyltransferase involved in cell wall biosynthesis